jgi:flagellar biosynthesis anti-sigma factor FlgM
MVVDPQTPVPDTTASAVSGEPNDTVQLSAGQATLSRLVAQLASVPDIRQDKVSALQSEIQSGRFQRSNDQVAGAIVNEYLGSASTT